MKEYTAYIVGILLFALGFLVAVQELVSPILHFIGEPDWILVLSSVTAAGGLATIFVGDRQRQNE